jgi:hypothetical protein
MSRKRHPWAENPARRPEKGGPRTESRQGFRPRRGGFSAGRRPFRYRGRPIRSLCREVCLWSNGLLKLWPDRGRRNIRWIIARVIVASPGPGWRS